MSHVWASCSSALYLSWVQEWGYPVYDPKFDDPEWLLLPQTDVHKRWAGYTLW